MAAQKFLAKSAAGLDSEIAATQTSAGAANANQIPALSGNGFFDPSLFPAGIGTATLNLPSSELIAAEAAVNIYSAAGVPTMRNANATDNTKPAMAFCPAGCASGASANVNFSGQIVTGQTGLTIGGPVFLSATTPGGATPVVPTTTGNLLQFLGWALSATSYIFMPNTGVTRA
jgi:hypothetical protein